MYIPNWLIILGVLLLSFLYLKRTKNPKEKANKHIINLSIEFNIDEIAKLIKNHHSIKDSPLNNGCSEEKWESSTIKKYDIDIIPNGKTDIFFHKTTNTFSHLINAHDYFENSSELIDKYIQKNKIEKFSWERWREYISVHVSYIDENRTLHTTPIILVPIQEIGELMMYGEFKNLESCEIQEEKMKIPTRFESNQPMEFIEIWKILGGSSNWISYRNKLAKISATVPIKLEENY